MLSYTIITTLSSYTNHTIMSGEGPTSAVRVCINVSNQLSLLYYIIIIKNVLTNQNYLELLLVDSN